jgi:transcriptional regulator with XRE-family HTH domain
MRYPLRFRDDRDLVSRYEAIAGELVEQRRARGLSQQELAELVGTTQSAIARIERGQRPPKVDTLLRIANALDCELEIRLRPRTETTGGEHGSRA